MPLYASNGNYADYPKVTAVVGRTVDGQDLTLTMSLHPGGPKVQNSLLLARRLESLQRIQKHIERIDKRMESSEMTIDEYQKLMAEADQWQELAGLIQMAKALILSSVARWDYFKDKEAEAANDPFPINEETLAMLTDNQIMSLVTAIQGYYSLGNAEGKESAGSSPGESATPMDLPEQSPISTPSTKSPENTTNPRVS